MRSKSSRYVDLLGAVTPAAPAVTKALVAPKPVAKEHQMAAVFKERVLPGVVAGAVGAYFFKKHRVLGALGGLAVGSTAYPIVKDEDRTRNLCYLAAAGAGVAGSLYAQKHKTIKMLGKARPAVGYVVPAVVVSAVANHMLKK
jgi:hypothetical protein